MSLLGTPVYANPSKPLWASASGGAITGNLNVTGQVTATGGFSGRPYVVTDLSGSTGMLLSATIPGEAYIQAQSNINFGQIGQGVTNTSLTISAPGSGLDLLTTNFLRAIGPIPTQSVPVGANPTVNLTAGTPSRTDIFAVTTLVPVVSNAEYDVQATGSVTWTSGPAPTSGDQVAVRVSVGSGTVGQVAQVFYPANDFPNWILGVGNTFSIRGRIIAAASPSANVTCSVTYSGAAGTGTISGTLNLLDVVRVA